jgi:phosphoribosylamine--glycine ligase
VRVVEFNARFGDPETQVVLPRLATPLTGLLYAAATGALAAHPPLQWREQAAVTVVVASEGYPGTPRNGDPVHGLDAAEEVPGAWVLHAGTRASSGDGSDGEVVSAGGRVLSVVGTGETLAAARETAYRAVARISLAGSHHRSDIAERAAAGDVVLPAPV